jgi:hypothetical protein
MCGAPRSRKMSVSWYATSVALFDFNGRNILNFVKWITELKLLWPELKLVHGRPRHPQSQGSVERANADIKSMIISWTHENNNTHWSEGLTFVQFQKNRSYLVSFLLVGVSVVVSAFRSSSVSSVSNISFGMADEDKPTFGTLSNNALYGDWSVVLWYDLFFWNWTFFCFLVPHTFYKVTMVGNLLQISSPS